MAKRIRRRSFLKVMGLGFGLGAAGTSLAVRVVRAAAGAAAAGASAGRRPNILFILIDDMGWRDVGFMGSKFYLTPNIDRLASQGMVFTRAYANGPNCAPTRACLMSGQYTPRHGVYTVGTSERGQASRRKLIPIKNTTTLDPKFVTLAESLKSAGYVTAMMGKWHLGGDAETCPEAQGFDVNVGGTAAGNPSSYFSPYHNPKLPDGPKGEYLTDRLTDEAIKFIDAQAKAQADAGAAPRPFFLYLPEYAVHTPLQAKADKTEKYKSRPADGGQQNATYAAMIESTDDGIGRILARLDDLKLAENTLVIFFSDNGGVGGITSNAPLRGAKGMLYEGGIREPMIVRWPGKVKPGSKCGQAVIGIDFYPTFLEVAGAPAPAGQVLDGVSIVSLMTESGPPEPRAIFWHFPCYLEGATPSGWRTTPAGAVQMGDWKLIEFFEDSHVELYNLADDIGETKDLAAAMPDKAKGKGKQKQATRE
jgi:arylsulfatase A-like enzyme